MDITAHIRELLFGHDCVIIPGFGGFIGNYSPARIEKTAGIFHPPVKKISFNRNLNHNDGLLIKKITESSGMNYGDTREMVEGFVADLRKKLERGEKVVFEHIGSFINNSEGNVQFEPDEKVNYHLDSFGFEPFKCLPLEGLDVRRRVRETASEQKNYNLRKYIWRAAVIIPLAGAIIAVSLNADFLKARVETTNLNPLVNAELEHNRESLAEKTETAKPEFTIADTAGESNPVEAIIPESVNEQAPEIQAPPITAKNTYYIITGSFQSEENAGKQISQLQAAGFNPEIISADNGFYRVCAMECPDLATAIDKKDSIVLKFPGAWISRKK